MNKHTMLARTGSALVAVVLLTSCSQGQRGSEKLTNEMDSVSYAIGVEIGSSMRDTPLKGLNLAAFSKGMREGLDSTATMSKEEQMRVMQGFNRKMQEERMAKEMAEGEKTRVAGEEFLAQNGKRAGVVTTPSGLQYEVVTMGTGAKPLPTNKVKVHYTGTLIDGSEFDSSKRRGAPAVFPVGQVIRGWVEGLQLMPVGSTFKFAIPSDLAYGPSGGPGGSIPPFSTLLFEVELIEIVE